MEGGGCCEATPGVLLMFQTPFRAPSICHGQQNTSATQWKLAHTRAASSLLRRCCCYRWQMYGAWAKESVEDNLSLVRGG